MLQVGDAAPPFDLPTDGDNSLSSTSLEGKPYVLYFYPKDNTPGCTKEGCDFRDNFARITSLGATVVGVSPDSPKRHAGFRSKHEFPFSLISDEELTLHKAYGSWGPKKFMGREYEGTLRSTFLVDGSGTIARVWPKVRVKGHVDEVIEALSELNEG